MLILLPAATSPAQTTECNTGSNTFSWSFSSAGYRLRPNDRRCEGIKPEPAGNGFELISFTISSIASIGRDRGEKLTLKVPHLSNFGSKPVVNVKAEKNYYLDPIEFNKNSNYYTFNWSNEILWDQKIDLNSLRSLAYFQLNPNPNSSQRLHIPVTIGQPQLDGNRRYQYEFKIHLPGTMRFPSIKILNKNGDIIYEDKDNNWDMDSEYKWKWNGKKNDGKNASAGHYYLDITGDPQQSTGNQQTLELRIQFAHDSKWLEMT